MRLAVLEDRITADLGCGATGLVPELEQLVAAHPLRERLWEHLVVALYRAGRQTDAIRRAHDVRELLAEVGLERSPRLRALEDAILRHDTAVLEVGELAPAAVLDRARAPARRLPAATALRRPAPTPATGSTWPTSVRPSCPRSPLVASHQPRVRRPQRRAAPPRGGLEVGVRRRGLAGRRRRRAGHRQVLAGHGSRRPHGPRRRGAGRGPLLARAGAALRALRRGVRTHRRRAVRRRRGRPRQPRLAARRAAARPAPPASARSRGTSTPPSAAAAWDRRAKPDDSWDGPERRSGSDRVDRYLLFESVAALVAHITAIAPLVLVIDDLQWADRSTLRLAEHLLRADTTTRLLILATVRDTEADPSAHVRTLLDHLHRERLADELPLGGFTVEEVGEVLADQSVAPRDPELAETLREATGGNPFFVVELARTIDDAAGAREPLTVPSTAQALVRSRVEALDTDQPRRARDRGAHRPSGRHRPRRPRRRRPHRDHRRRPRRRRAGRPAGGPRPAARPSATTSCGPSWRPPWAPRHGPAVTAPSPRPSAPGRATTRAACSTPWPTTTARRPPTATPATRSATPARRAARPSSGSPTTPRCRGSSWAWSRWHARAPTTRASSSTCCSTWRRPGAARASSASAAAAGARALPLALAVGEARDQARAVVAAGHLDQEDLDRPRPMRGWSTP